MKRRDFLAATAALALPLAARAQDVRVVGVLAPHSKDPNYRAFPEELRRLGYEPGRNLRLIYRSAEGNYDRLPALAAEIVAARPEVIVAINTPGARAAIRTTHSVPIVMTIVGDPIGSGFVTNLAHPGGNVTGVSAMTRAIASKRIQILRELLPKMKRVAAIFNPVDPVTKPQIEDLKRDSPALGVETRFLAVKTDEELREAFREAATWKADAAIWLSGQATAFQSASSSLAMKQRLPLMVIQRTDVEAGGLISYFPDFAQLYRRTATYVDRILKGESPGELPVELPRKFELAVNLKTARAIGLAVPRPLLLRADRVIE